MTSGNTTPHLDDAITQNSLPIVPVGLSTADRWVAEVHSLLRELETATTADQVLPPIFSEAIDARLVQARLGVAAGLFAALQCKHAATAGHSLRVAIRCSGWASRLNVGEDERNAIEVAALLHDIGVLVVPDTILQKPSRLNDDEAAAMARSRGMGLDILRRGSASRDILEILEHLGTWFNAEKEGKTAPLGSRMIAIAEAFDAMTTDRVFRPALTHERAMAELFEHAGTQFDPELVAQFEEYCREDPVLVRDEVAYRWLRILDPATIYSAWGVPIGASSITEQDVGSMFQGRLLDAMYDAVAFVDVAGRIVLWNRGAERLTGVMGDCICGELWRPALLGLADEKGNPVGEADCPVFTAIRCGAQSLRRLTLLGRRQQTVAVDSHAIPVIDQKGVTHGAVLVFHDASSEISLERQCQNLSDRVTKDSMTQLANRAEFDRVHAMFVATHRQQQAPCSLLMFDLDRFKHVNDTYGHQAGDDVIRSMSELLKSSCRPGDLVARYGGEEFVFLCADCNGAAAVRRAEQIRQAFSRIPHPRMGGRTGTVSIGVTEVQPGDTPETMLRRADRALLTAKAAGRNVVVQLGAGAKEPSAGAGFAVRRSKSAKRHELFAQELITPVPVKMAAEKLRGFVADHQARITAIEENWAKLEIDDRPAAGLRRFTDRPTTFCLELRFTEEQVCDSGDRQTPAAAVSSRTRISVSVSVTESRNRRRNGAAAKARDLLISFRSYMMADECTPIDGSGMITRVKRMFTPWRE